MYEAQKKTFLLLFFMLIKRETFTRLENSGKKLKPFLFPHKKKRKKLSRRKTNSALFLEKVEKILLMICFFV
jgi:hypothetical protein